MGPWPGSHQSHCVSSELRWVCFSHQEQGYCGVVSNFSYLVAGEKQRKEALVNNVAAGQVALDGDSYCSCCASLHLPQIWFISFCCPFSLSHLCLCRKHVWLVNCSTGTKSTVNKITVKQHTNQNYNIIIRESIAKNDLSTNWSLSFFQEINGWN